MCRERYSRSMLMTHVWAGGVIGARVPEEDYGVASSLTFCGSVVGEINIWKNQGVKSTSVPKPAAVARPRTVCLVCFGWVW
jgi:hypothetical protein